MERAHRTLKEMLEKQKGGIGHGRTPKERIALALFTLNFLILDSEGLSAADHHCHKGGSLKGFVKWKDVLTGTWHGPDPVLAWARGSVCVFHQDRLEPFWIPECLACKCDNHEEFPDTAAACAGDDPHLGQGGRGTQMGDIVCVSKTPSNSS